jgi:hypothetical protein
MSSTRFISSAALIGALSGCHLDDQPPSIGASVDAAVDASLIDGPLEAGRPDSSKSSDAGATVIPPNQPELTYVGPGANGVAAGNYESNFEVWTANRDGTNNTRIRS